jgi:protein-disulfide isomerase-like protein with CxxC motif
MKTNKIVVAFLVSAGLFSAIQAEQYVEGLSVAQKKALLSVKNVSADVFLTGGSYYGDGPDEDGNNKA